MDEPIAKLEALDGPDRELDAEIAGTDPTTVHWHDEDETPRYTASIDAAVTLIPEGWYCDYDGQLGVIHLYRKGDMKTHMGQADTPAVAICIAALKAKSDL
jgi:hypothetical protein